MKIAFVGEVRDPRFVTQNPALRPEREESKVAVRHIAVLGASQKLAHDRKIGMTVHDHCGMQHIT